MNLMALLDNASWGRYYAKPRGKIIKTQTKLKERESELNLFIILLFQMDTAPYSPGVEATKARLGLLSKQDGLREHSYES